MDAYIDNQNTFTNVTEWQEAGYTGRGVVVWDMEGLSDHGKVTKRRILDAAPDATVINRPWNKGTSNGKMSYERVYDEDGKTYLSFSEFVEKFKPKILSSSKSSSKSKAITEGIAPILKTEQQKHNLVIFNSAGNDGGDGVQGGAIPQEFAMYIGAVMMFKNDPNDIRPTNYSSLGDEFEEVDFSSFVGRQGYSGTSFSCPFVAGQAALLIQRYGDMSQQEVYNYLKMCSYPLNTGHNSLEIDIAGSRYIYDYLTGYGIPVMPHLEKNYITMDIGSKVFKINGETEEMDTAPFIKDSRSFVPIAFVALALGAEVKWNAVTRAVRITKGSMIVDLYIGKKYYYVNGKRYEMDTAPFIKDSRTFVPIAFLAGAIGCKVAWCPAEQRVQILEA